MQKIKRIINIVDNLSNVNFGIWNAAIAQATSLHKLGIDSEIWFPKASDNQVDKVADCVQLVELKETSTAALKGLIASRDLQPATDVIVTHGAWRFATAWGNALAAKGFRWMYVPHGMLEPWSMKQKKIKKAIYWHLIESRLIRSASWVRAVGLPEAKNLEARSLTALTIPNSIPVPNFLNEPNKSKTIKFLFMARLHHKKGVLPLLQAWKASALYDNPAYSLNIAGPGEGELEKLQSEGIDGNSSYIGSVYGDDKAAILAEATFYVLPSFSEGFPTSVIEAMSYGCIPLISNGCNFPEAFDAKMAILAEPNKADLVALFNAIEAKSIVLPNPDAIKAFALTNYADDVVTKRLVATFTA